MLRPISRKYDLAEHEYPRELDLMSAVIDGMNDSGSSTSAGATSASQVSDKADGEVRNGTNMSSLLSIIETCRGDVGLTLSMPRQGLGNAAIAAVANEDQKKRYAGMWAAMAITEPEVGSDAAAIRTTLSSTAMSTCSTARRSTSPLVSVPIWSLCGRRWICRLVARRSSRLWSSAANPGMKLVRLEHKLGIRASDTAAFLLENCRVPKEDLLGSPEIETKAGFGGAMQTFDNTRPLVAAMALGVARASLDLTTELLAKEGVVVDNDRPAHTQSAAAAKLIQMEADYEAAYLLAVRAAWMADNGKPNSVEASMAKAKAGRSCVNIAFGCIELCGATGYAERELMEKWARDGKILDIFEGTQQIQLLVIARRLLDLSSSQLK